MSVPPAVYGTTTLNLTVRSTSGALIVRAHGEVDLSSVSLLTAVFDAGVAAGCDRAVVDAADVTFIDAAGLAGMLAFPGAGGLGAVRVENPSPRVQRLLELTGLCHLVDVRDPSVPTLRPLAWSDVEAPRSIAAAN
jgi:anti-anti-sigma factor